MQKCRTIKLSGYREVGLWERTRIHIGLRFGNKMSVLKTNYWVLFWFVKIKDILSFRGVANPWQFTVTILILSAICDIKILQMKYM